MSDRIWRMRVKEEWPWPSEAEPRLWLWLWRRTCKGRMAMGIPGPGMAMAMAEEWVYRVCPEEEWASGQAAGALHGGPLDTSTGFIHLSTAAQVVGTLSRFYAGRDDLYLLKINASKLGNGLQYDNVEGVGKFPHFYGPNGTFCPLPLSAVEASAKVKLESGKHILPFGSTDS